MNDPLVNDTGVTGRKGISVRARRAQRLDRTTSTPELVTLATLGAALGAMAPGEATGMHSLDIALRSAVGLLFVLAASRSSPRARVVGSLIVALAATFAFSSLAAVPAYVALGLALGGEITSRDDRTLAAFVGLLLGQAALRLEAPRTTGLTALFAFLALAELGISALGRIDTRPRRAILRLLTSIIALAVFVSVGYGVLVLIARSEIDRGIDAVRVAVAAARDGNTSAATNAFTRASTAFRHAERLVDGPWAQPARAVPITGKYAQALALITKSGTELASTGATLAQNTDTKVTLQGGGVQLDRVRGLQSPLTAASSTLDRVAKRLDSIDTTWLASPLSGRIRRLDVRVMRARDDVSTAMFAIRVLPAMLGGDGERRYFVAFQTPAEQRASGGIIGNYAEISFTDGRFDKVASGRDLDLNTRGNPRTLIASEEYVHRYAERWMPADFWQNVTVSPDLPTVARVIEGLYPQSGGNRVDGVISIDPIALAAFLELTGPVHVKDLPFPLTSENAAQVLLRDQYTRFGSNAQRIDFLGEAIDTVIDRLKHGNLPPPARIAQVLGPAVRQGRLKLHSVHADEQRFLERIGVAGEFPTHTSGDFIALVTQNASLNKIDVFQRRSLDYDVQVDATGHVTATATITLYNDAPRSGLPPYVIGGPPVRLLDDGDAKPYLSVYTPLTLRRATLNGAVWQMDAATELGKNVYSKDAVVQSHGSVVVRLELEGRVALAPMGDRRSYRLDVWAQPTIRPDTVTVHVRGPRGAALRAGPGQRMEHRDGQLSGEVQVFSPTWFTASIERR